MIAAEVTERLRAGLDRAQLAALFPQLSRREQEVLTLTARGQSNEQIARTLFLSVKTVRNNVSTILTKLGVHDRAGAVVRARDVGRGSRSTPH